MMLYDMTGNANTLAVMVYFHDLELIRIFSLSSALAIVLVERKTKIVGESLISAVLVAIQKANQDGGSFCRISRNQK